MTGIPEAKLVATVIGGRSVFVRLCPVEGCGKRIRERKKVIRIRDEQSGAVSEQTELDSDNYAEHYRTEHAQEA